MANFGKERGLIDLAILVHMFKIFAFNPFVQFDEIFS
jgi:hypothetical protein